MSYEPVPLLHDFLINLRSCRCGRLFTSPLSWYDHICEGRCYECFPRNQNQGPGYLIKRHKQLQYKASRLWPDYFPHPFDCDWYNEYRSEYCLTAKRIPQKTQDCGICVSCDRILNKPLFIVDGHLNKAPCCDVTGHVPPF